MPDAATCIGSPQDQESKHAVSNTSQTTEHFCLRMRLIQLLLSSGIPVLSGLQCGKPKKTKTNNMCIYPCIYESFPLKSSRLCFHLPRAGRSTRDSLCMECEEAPLSCHLGPTHRANLTAGCLLIGWLHLGGIILKCRCCLINCRLFHGTSPLPADASGSPSLPPIVTTKIFSRHCQMSLGVRVGGKNSPVADRSSRSINASRWRPVL